MWSLLHLRPGGFPWLVVAGKRLTGWIVIDLDATVITSASKKTGAAVTFKRTSGFHPLAAWCADTTESLAMLLRAGDGARLLLHRLPLGLGGVAFGDQGGVGGGQDLVSAPDPPGDCALGALQRRHLVRV